MVTLVPKLLNELLQSAPFAATVHMPCELGLPSCWCQDRKTPQLTAEGGEVRPRAGCPNV